MRIGFVRLTAAPVLLPHLDGLFGGAEVRSVTFARGLARFTGHEVTFVVQGTGGDQTLQDGLRVRQVMYRRRWTRPPGWQPQVIWQWPVDLARKCGRSLQRRIGRRPAVWSLCGRLPVDVLATFGVHDPSASVIESARRSGKQSVLFLTSDREADEALAAATGRSARALCLHRHAIMHADLIVAQTAYQQDVVRRQAGRDAVLIRNPIDPDLGVQALLPLEQRPYVLWVGRADRDCKRADRCIQLARESPGVPFVAVMNPLATRDRDRDKNRLSADVPRNLRVLERVGWAESDELFQHARALLNTSDSEGFPNAFLQAAKRGCPIISLTVNPDRVLTEQRLGFCAGGDLSRMSEMVRCLWQHPERFHCVSRAARQYVVGHHDWRACVAQLDQALQELVAAQFTRRAA